MEYYHFQLKKTRAAFIKLGHRFSQILTDIWLFVAFNILVIRVHPCPQKKIPILSSYNIHKTASGQEYDPKA